MGIRKWAKGRRRGPLRTLLVFVLLGAVATVLSAWAIHAVQFWRLHQGSRVAYGWTRVEHEASPLWRGGESATIGAFGSWRVLPDDPRWHDPVDQRILAPIRRRGAGWHVESQDFSTSISAELDHFPSREAMCIFDAGFPSRSMRCGSYVGRFFEHGFIQHDTHTDGSSWHGGLQLSPWTPGVLPPTVFANGRIAPLDRFALPLLPL